jgi:hypothetical protein
LKKHDESNLWHYVTGLRGNDDGNLLFKDIVTTTIRGDVDKALGFDEPHILNLVALYRHSPQEMEVEFRESLRCVTYHTKTHALYAIRALETYYAHKHGNQYKRYAELLHYFGASIESNDSSKALLAWKQLHEMWVRP